MLNMELWASNNKGEVLYRCVITHKCVFLRDAETNKVLLQGANFGYLSPVKAIADMLEHYHQNSRQLIAPETDE